jgi:hypothetical protein
MKILKFFNSGNLIDNNHEIVMKFENEHVTLNIKIKTTDFKIL